MTEKMNQLVTYADLAPGDIIDSGKRFYRVIRTDLICGEIHVTATDVAARCFVGRPTGQIMRRIREKV